MSTSGISPPDPTLSEGTTAGRSFRRLRSAVVVAAVLAVVGSACDYTPADFAGTPALSECAGVPATIGIGWHEAVDDPGGSTYYGTEGDDVVVITNGPVKFAGLGGDDLICINDTNMTWGVSPGPVVGWGYCGLNPSASVIVQGGSGNDTVYSSADSPVFSVCVELGDGDDFFFGGDASESVGGGPGADSIHAGAGVDTVGIDRQGPGEDLVLDCGPGEDRYDIGLTHDSALVDCEVGFRWGLRG